MLTQTETATARAMASAQAAWDAAAPALMDEDAYDAMVAAVDIASSAVRAADYAKAGDMERHRAAMDDIAEMMGAARIKALSETALAFVRAGNLSGAADTLREILAIVRPGA